MRKRTKKEEKYIMSQIYNVLDKGFRIACGIEKPTNEINHIKGGFISYNPTTDVGKETALCFDNGDYFILLGDFRKNLKNCRTIEECVSVFKELLKKKKKISPWSNFDYKLNNLK